MKKILSAILIMVLILFALPLNSFAEQENTYGGIDMSKYSKSELDLSQFTLEDIMNMSAEEYGALVREFERVYDPYGTYVEGNETMLNNGEEFSPLWTSGEESSGEWTESGSHEYITAAACSILSTDKGFYSNGAAAVTISLLISVASLRPDKDEIGVVIFAGHFYDPATQENYANQTNNTAKTNAVKHYNSAVSAANSGNMELAYEYLGRCLHYVQDANVPHHAANVTAINSSHGNFESFAFNNIESILGSYTSISSGNYTTAINASVSSITHNVAVNAKMYINRVNDSSNTSQWYSTANTCLKNAAKDSAMIMYKFGMESSVPFYT